MSSQPGGRTPSEAQAERDAAARRLLYRSGGGSVPGEAERETYAVKRVDSDYFSDEG